MSVTVEQALIDRPLSLGIINAVLWSVEGSLPSGGLLALVVKAGCEGENILVVRAKSERLR